VKILQANKFYFRNGGSETVMFQERDYLLQTGHDVVAFSMQDDRNLASGYLQHFVEGQNYRVGDAIFEKLKSAISLVHSSDAVKSISALIRATQPDLMHCHNIYHQLSPSIIGAAKKLGVPVVLTLHDSKLVCPVYNRLRDEKPCSLCLDGDFGNVVKHRCADGSLGKSILLFAEATIQRWMQNYEKVDVFIAPSRFMQEAISHRISSDKIRLLYNGVDTNAIQVCDDDDGYVLYLGRLSAEKGVRTLLETHKASSHAWPIIVAGTGPLSDEYKRDYPDAQFVGHVSGNRLMDIIKRAAAVVVPSECYENCPMSVLEAMAYGKPVVGSRMGGIPELVEDGETGLLFEAGNSGQLGEQISKLMSAPELRRKMGQCARSLVEQKFSLETHNQGLLEIYESLVVSA
jgi:glycosyltransferase involved in cell wall biosynthesis